jgi:hypothetical protein
MRLPDLPETLRLDAAANLAGAAVLALTSPLLAGPAGLEAMWPLWLAAAALAAYGVENHLTARRPRRPTVTALIVADVVFAAALLTLWATNPTGTEPWLRWTLFAVADLALIAAALKTYGLRIIQPQPTAHEPASPSAKTSTPSR